MNGGARVPARGGYACPFVVCWRGNLDVNQHNHGEISAHKTLTTAFRVMCRWADRMCDLFGPDESVFAWSVVDRRSGKTLAEAY